MFGLFWNSLCVSFRQTLTSPLKWQTRTIAVFPDAGGYALGSIEGRVAIQCVFVYLFRLQPGLWVNLLLTFCGPRPRNIEDKDQE